jgi:hydroxyethylthiazole kinase-like uncharacterized protein yjeF
VEAPAIPTLDNDQIRAIERLLINDYRIDRLQLLENAGRALADLAIRMIDIPLVEAALVVLAGKNNHGAAALVAARHLLARGAWVQIVGTHSPEQYRDAAAQQLAILQAMGATFLWQEEGGGENLPEADLLIDAMIGYGLRGDPRGRARELVLEANGSHTPILSLDVPTGVDSDKGICYTPHIRAAATLALSLPKRGLLIPPARSACGRIFVADQAWPLDVYAEIDIAEAPLLFQQESLVELQVIEGAAYLLAVPD